MKPRNYVIYGPEEWLKTLEAEYRMIGFYTKRTDESLTVFSRRPRKQQQKKRRNKQSFNRSKVQKPKQRNS